MLQIYQQRESISLVNNAGSRNGFPSDHYPALQKFRKMQHYGKTSNMDGGVVILITRSVQ